MEKMNAAIDEKEKQQEKLPSLGPSLGSNWKHMILMIMGCLAPVGVALMLTQVGYTGVGNYLLFLLCPIVHMIMMRNMDKSPKK